MIPTKPYIDMTYIVEVRKGWSYVIGAPMPEHSGPWRYQWEAQEYADELNGAMAFRCSCQIADHVSDECVARGSCRERRALEGK